MVFYEPRNIVITGDGESKHELLRCLRGRPPEIQRYRPHSWGNSTCKCLVPMDHPLAVDTNIPAPIQWKNWHEEWWNGDTIRRPQSNDKTLRILILIPPPGLWTIEQPVVPEPGPLEYALATLFCLCFDIYHPETLKSVYTRWLPELKHFSPNVLIVLIGCKIELRADASSNCLTTFSQGVEMAKRIGAQGYIECSTRTMENIECVLQFLCWTGAHHLLEKKQSCTIM